MKCRALKAFSGAVVASCVLLTGCGGGGKEPAASVTRQPAAAADDTSAGVGGGVVVDSGDTSGQSPVAPVPVPVPEPVVITETPQSKGGRIGANVGNVRYYSRAQEYVDMLRQAGGFGPVSGPWNNSPTIALDADGWPTEDFSVMVLGSQDARTPGLSGRYTLVFKQTALSRNRGDLRIAVGGPSPTVSASAISYDAATGLSYATMDLPAGVTDLWVTFTSTNGGLRDLKIIRPGYDWRASNLPVFTTTYLNHLRSLSTLRFMDWTSTNNNFVARWDSRPTLVNTRANANRAPGAQPGTPWERAIELANAANTDLWVNVPTRADGTYYLELARLIKANLKPNLNVYVEYSNEAWNGSFPQYHYLNGTNPSIYGNAVAEELAAGNTNLKFDETPSNTLSASTLATRIYIERLFRISEAFRQVFGDAQMITRVRPVLAWQVGAGSLFERMLAYAKRVYPNRAPSDALYAISSAPYFAMGSQKTVDGLSATQVLDALQASLDTLTVGYGYETSAYIAKKYGVKWVAYEGGADTFGPTSLAGKAESQRNARIKTLCKQNITDFQKAGGELFMYFLAGAGSWNTEFGTWALEEYLSPNVRSYKTQCLDELYASGPPEVSLRHKVGTAFDAAELVGTYLSPSAPDYPNARLFWAADQKKEYLIGSQSAACYNLTLSGTYSPGAPSQPQIEIQVNNRVVTANVALVRPATTGQMVATSAGQVCLEAGVNIVGLRTVSTSSSVQLDQLLVSVPSGN